MPNSQVKSLTVEGVTYDLVDKTSGYATETYVNTQIGNLPEPMIFKGSLGTGGTITTLPAAASSNEGYVYKVITDGTYSSQAAKVGDTFISDGSVWVLIPSGDEPSGTVTSVGVQNDTNGGLSVNGSPVTSSGTITIGHSNILTNAQTTQAVYPIKIDKNGHISAYGSAVSIPEIPDNTGSATTGISISDHSTGSIIGVQSSTTSVTGVQSSTTSVRGVKTGTNSTTTASKVTLGTAISVPNPSASDVTVPIRADSDTTVPTAASSATDCDDITNWAAGSGSLTFTMDSTDTKKLIISHTHTAPTLSYTAKSITGVSGSTTVRGVKTGTSSTTTASKVTMGTAISVPNVTAATDVTVPIRADADTTVPIKDASATTVPIKDANSTTVVTSKTHTVTDAGHTHTI